MVWMYEGMREMDLFGGFGEGSRLGLDIGFGYDGGERESQLMSFQVCFAFHSAMLLALAIRFYNYLSS